MIPLRIAGRNARFYVAVTSGGVAEPIPFLKSWSFKATTDRYDGTAFGDGNKTYVSGLPDAQGDVKGFYDTATAQFYTAASDGVARKVYAYPDIVSVPGQYWFGTAFLDFNSEFPVDGIATMDGSWAAASTFAKVG